jgi:hypothetical protein
METTDAQRLAVTPASPEASDALPGIPLPAQSRARSALAGFVGPDSPKIEEASALSLTEADKPGVGPLAWPARQPHGPLRRAWFPVSSPIGHGLGLFQSNREANA